MAVSVLRHLGLIDLRRGDDAAVPLGVGVLTDEQGSFFQRVQGRLLGRIYASGPADGDLARLLIGQNFVVDFYNLWNVFSYCLSNHIV